MYLVRNEFKWIIMKSCDVNDGPNLVFQSFVKFVRIVSKSNKLAAEMFCIYKSS